MKLRVGLVGVGPDWESRHRPALKSLSDRFDVRAVCSEVAVRAEQAASEFEADTVDGFRALSARNDIDALLMLSPDWYGPLPIFAACDSGKAIYCAGAMDMAPDMARQVRARVEESGIAFVAEFPRRCAPATLRLKELIATRLGQPKLLFCHRRHADDSNGCEDKKWTQSMRDLMELVDWCRYTVGMEPTSVIGVRHEDRSVDDYQMLSLDFSPPGAEGTGPMAQLSCSNYFSKRWSDAFTFRPPAELQVCCEKGVAFVDLPSSLVWFDEAGQHRESLEADRPVGEQLLTQFHRAVTSLVRSTTDLDDTYTALNIVLAARTSCEEGRRVMLD